MPLRLKVRDVLDQHGITPYRFWKESGLAQATAYKLVDETADLPTGSTLETTIRTLRALTGELVGVADVIEYAD